MKEKIKKKALINVLADVAKDRRKGIKFMKTGYQLTQKELTETKNALDLARKVIIDFKEKRTEGLAEQYKEALAEIEQHRTIFAAIRGFIPFETQEELVDAIAKLTTPVTDEVSNVKEFPLRDVATSSGDEPKDPFELMKWGNPFKDRKPAVTTFNSIVEGYLGPVPEVVKQATAEFQAEAKAVQLAEQEAEPEIEALSFDGNAIILHKDAVQKLADTRDVEEFEVYTKLIARGCAHDDVVGLNLSDKKQVLQNIEKAMGALMPTQQEQ